MDVLTSIGARPFLFEMSCGGTEHVMGARHCTASLHVTAAQFCMVRTLHRLSCNSCWMDSIPSEILLWWYKLDTERIFWFMAAVIRNLDLMNIMMEAISLGHDVYYSVR